MYQFFLRKKTTLIFVPFLIAAMLITSFLVFDTLPTFAQSVERLDDGIGPMEAMSHGGSHGDHMSALELLLPSEASHWPVRDGVWSDATIWNTGSVPGNGADVFITNDRTVTYDVNGQTEIGRIMVDGELHFATDRNTTLVFGTMITSPRSILTVGTVEDPILDTVSAELIVADLGSIDRGEDPKEIGRGLVTMGTVAFHGAKKETHLRLAREPRAGDSILEVLGDTSKWRVGDDLVIVGTEYLGKDSSGALKTQDEERTITAINGRTITLNQALRYNHVTPSFDVANSPIKKLYTYVGNLTNNITFTSESPDQDARAHFMIMSPGSDIRYTSFIEMGRTDARFSIENDDNTKGRYPLHIHQTGPKETDPKHFLVGNVVAHGPGWGITQHSSNAMIYKNFVYDIVGAGIVSEIGNERGEWISNLVSKIPGHGNNVSGCPEDTNVGCDGDAYFNNSRIITQQSNVAANAKKGWNFFGREDMFFDNGVQKGQTQDGPWRKVFEYGDIPVENFPFDSAMDHEEIPIVNFNNNEMFAVGEGIHVFHRQTADENDNKNSLRRLAIWNTGGSSISMKNYVNNYLIKDSLLQSGGMRIERKSDAQNLTNVHFGRGSYSSHSINHESTLIGVTFDSGGVVQKDLLSRASDVAAREVTALYAGLGLDYRNPERNMVVISDADLVTPVDITSVRILPGGDTTLSPRDNRLDFKAEYTDSLGTVRLNEYIIAKPPKGTGTTKQHLGVDVILSGTKKYSSVRDVLDRFGTYQQANGSWISPVVYWLGDRLTGENFPVVVPINLTGWSDSEMRRYQRPYPNLAPVRDTMHVVELPSSSGVSKPEGVAVAPIDLVDPPTVAEPLPTSVNNPFPAGTEVVVTESVNVRSTYGVGGALQGQQTAGMVGSTLDESAFEANGFTWVAVDFIGGVDGWLITESIDAYVPPATIVSAPPEEELISDNGEVLASDDVFATADLFIYDVEGESTQIVGNVLENDLGVSKRVTELAGRSLGSRRNAEYGLRVSVEPNGDVSVRSSNKTPDVDPGDVLVGDITYKVTDASGTSDIGTLVIEIRNETGITVVPDNFEPVSTPETIASDPVVTSQFDAGVEVVTLENVNVRNSAGTSGSLVGQQPAGSLGEVLDATPVEANGFTWVRVNFDFNPIGWIADAFLSKAPAPVVPEVNTPEVTEDPVETTTNIVEANNDTFSFNQQGDNTQTIGNVLNNDSGESIEVVSLAGRSLGSRRNGDNGGRISLSADGDFSFRDDSSIPDLAPGEELFTSIDYEIEDADGDVSEGTVTVRVHNDPSVLGASVIGVDSEQVNSLERIFNEILDFLR